MGHDRNITSCKCAVYGSELSRAGKLILARQHNEFNQIQCTTTFPEMSACCRRLMFAHFAPDQYDDGTYVPDVPRYNAQPYQDWKSECTTFLQSSSAVSKILNILISCDRSYFTCIFFVNRANQWLNKQFKWLFNLLASITRCSI